MPLYFARAGDGKGGAKGAYYTTGDPDIDLFPNYLGSGDVTYYRCLFAEATAETPASPPSLNVVLDYDDQFTELDSPSDIKFDWFAGGDTRECRQLITTQYDTEVWARIYVTNWFDDPFYRYQVVLENQAYSGVTVPTGDFEGDAAVAPSFIPGGIRFLFSTPTLLRFSDYHASGALSQTMHSGSPYYQWEVLPSGSTDENYLGAFQGRAWEFLVGKTSFCSYSELWDILTGAPVTGSAYTKTLAAEYEDPLWAVPDIDTLRESKAWWFGGLTAPLKVSAGDMESFRSTVQSAFDTELGRDAWGVWGGTTYCFGDVVNTHETSTPRNSDGAMWIRRAVQARRPKYGRIDYERANAQALRVLHRCFQETDNPGLMKQTFLHQWSVYSAGLGGNLWNLFQDNPDYACKNSPDPRKPADPTGIYKKPHGYENVDIGHVATEFLIDSYIYHANAFAYDELHFLGWGYPYCWPNPKEEFWGNPNVFSPAQWPKETRPEGWTNMVGVMAYQAVGTGLLSSATHVYERFQKMEAERNQHTIPNPTGAGTITLPEHDYELPDTYTHLYGYTTKAITFFQVGALCYAAIAAGYPNYALDQIRGMTYPFHAWDRVWPWWPNLSGKPAYYYEAWVHPDSWTHKYNLDNQPAKWYASGVPGRGTAEMVFGVFRYAAVHHPEEAIRTQISGKLDRLITTYHYSGWTPGPDTKWSQWWDEV